MKEKPSSYLGYREVKYSSEHWVLLEDLRNEAIQIMAALENRQLETVIHGSIARGDVNKKSDIDVFIPRYVSSFTVETALEEAEIRISRRLVVQATPTYSMKAYIEIGDNVIVSFPLMRMRRVEKEFYRFGGEASVMNLREGFRVPGVDKRLMLIEPTMDGHKESRIIGFEEHVAKMLDISVETVLDRVHALLRRDEVGRTGVFIEEELLQGETFELKLKKLADKNPAVRRRLKML